MVTWNPDAEDSQPLDFRLVRNSPVTMYWSPTLLAENVQWLMAHGYDVSEMDSSAWSTEQAMLEELALRLRFPDYFGRNLNALNDCLSEVAAHEYGWREDATGLVLVLHRFDAFSRRVPETAQALLDIVATNARTALLFGHRLLCLVQSEDPRLSPASVGAMPVVWNDTSGSTPSAACSPQPTPARKRTRRGMVGRSPLCGRVGRFRRRPRATAEERT